MTRKIGSYWADGLSIIETKFSILILLLVISFIVSIYFFVTGKEIGDINANLLEIIKILIYAITGINIADKASEIIVGRQKIKETEEKLKEHE